MSTTADFQRVRLLLLREWDPIGIGQMRDYNEATEDEYDGYAREIAGMVARNASLDEVFAYLKWASTENMGLSIFQEAKARRAAESIVRKS